MSKSTVLLVGGRLRSGKDAFADYLVLKHGYVKLGMSDILAEALYVLDPWVEINPADSEAIAGFIKKNFSWKERLIGRLFYSRSHFVGYQDLVDELGYVEGKVNHEVRGLLQRLGTEVGRNLLGEDIWVDAIKKKILGLQDQGAQNIVITGARFPNELGLADDPQLDTADGIITSIWVERPDLPALPSAGHSSEGSVHQEDFEYILYNDEDLRGLCRMANDLLVTIAVDND